MHNWNERDLQDSALSLCSGIISHRYSELCCWETTVGKMNDVVFWHIYYRKYIFEGNTSSFIDWVWEARHMRFSAGNRKHSRIWLETITASYRLFRWFAFHLSFEYISPLSILMPAHLALFKFNRTSWQTPEPPEASIYEKRGLKSPIIWILLSRNLGINPNSVPITRKSYIANCQISEPTKNTAVKETMTPSV